MEPGNNQLVHRVSDMMVENALSWHDFLKQKISTRKTELYQIEVKVEIIETVRNNPGKNNEEITQIILNQANRPSYANLTHAEVLNQVRVSHGIPDKNMLISSLKLQKDMEDQKVILMAKYKELLQKWIARTQSRLGNGIQEINDMSLATEYASLMQMVNVRN